MDLKKIIKIVSVLVLTILLYSSFYIVGQSEQAILTEFGDPVGEPVKTSGLKFKVPWYKVILIDKRLHSWDGDANQIPTKDKKFIFVEASARWRVADVLKLIKTVQSIEGAYGKLDTVIDSATRTVISSNNLVEAVRNSNEIIDDIADTASTKDSVTGKNTSEEGHVFAGEIIKVEKGREKLQKEIAARIKESLAEMGIELVDVQFKRIAYVKAVEQQVFLRMISERQSIASLIRAEGLGEKQKILGDMEEEQMKIESAAYKEAQGIRGAADATAYKVYADAYNQGREFFALQKRLDGYKKIFEQQPKMIVSPRSNYFKYLK